MDKKEEINLLRLNIRENNKKCNHILNLLDMVKGSIRGLKRIDLDTELKENNLSNIVGNLETYQDEIRRTKEDLDNIVDMDLEEKEIENKENEEIDEVEVIDDY